MRNGIGGSSGGGRGGGSGIAAAVAEMSVTWPLHGGGGRDVRLSPPLLHFMIHRR